LSGQVNTAVTELDGMVHQNADNAKASAGAWEKISAQAEQVRGFVDELLILVKGIEAL